MRYVLGIAMILMVVTAQPMALARHGQKTHSGIMTAAKEPGSEGTVAGGGNLTLDNIQDVAFTLQRIRQQAINVFVEATRKKVYRFDLKVPSLASMPKTSLEDQSAYLPLRKGWLMFFIGTMEPLVDILNEHLKSLDERTTRSKLASQYRPEWESIVKDWTVAIHELNKQLDVCAALLDDPGAGNVQVARAAVAIDGRIAALDNILHKASSFLQGKLATRDANDIGSPL